MDRNPEYWEAWNRLYPAMCARLRADGIDPPSRCVGPSGDDLTAEDAEAEITAMEAMIRKHHRS